MVMVRESGGGPGAAAAGVIGGRACESPLGLLGKATGLPRVVWRGERGGAGVAPAAGLYPGVSGGPCAESKEPGWA